MSTEAQKSTEKTSSSDSSFVDLFDLNLDEFKVEDVTEEPTDIKPDPVEEPEEEVVETGAEKQAEEVETPSEEEEEDASAEQQPAEETPEELENTPVGDLMEALVNDEVLDFDEEKEYDMTEEGLRELIEETVQKKSEQAIEKYKENLGDKGAKLLSVLEKGGSVDDFVKMETQVDFTKIPLEDKDGNQYIQNQKYLVEDWLKLQGYEDEVIEEQIADLAEAGLLKKQANLAKKKLADWQDKQNQALIEKKEQEKREAEELSIREAEAFKEEVYNTREIAGFKLTEKKAKTLYDYITKPDKDGKTQFQKEDTPENRLLYALFAMEGFDKEKLTKSIATEQTRSFKKKLNRYSDTNAAPKRSGGEVRRSNQETPKINWGMI